MVQIKSQAILRGLGRIPDLLVGRTWSLPMLRVGLCVPSVLGNGDLSACFFGFLPSLLACVFLESLFFPVLPGVRVHAGE